jgi:hypothetical protein
MHAGWEGTIPSIAERAEPYPYPYPYPYYYKVR